MASRLVRLLTRNAQPATKFFNIPPDRVFEIGAKSSSNPEPEPQPSPNSSREPLPRRQGGLPCRSSQRLHGLWPSPPPVRRVGLSGLVTYRVFRSRVFEKAQKLNQAKLIWLLPVLGAIMVFSVLHQEERAEREGPLLRL